MSEHEPPDSTNPSEIEALIARLEDGQLGAEDRRLISRLLRWRAYDQAVLKGRMHRYEMAVLKRVLRKVRRVIGRRRLRVTADRGFADVELCDLLEVFDTVYVIRVKSSTKVYLDGAWRRLQVVSFVGNSRQRNLGRVRYCESSPRTLWIGFGSCAQ